MMSAKQDVKLYVYDVSKGLARSVSPVLLGESCTVLYPYKHRLFDSSLILHKNYNLGCTT